MAITRNPTEKTNTMSASSVSLSRGEILVIGVAYDETAYTKEHIETMFEDIKLKYPKARFWAMAFTPTGEN